MPTNQTFVHVKCLKQLLEEFTTYRDNIPIYDDASPDVFEDRATVADVYFAAGSIATYNWVISVIENRLEKILDKEEQQERTEGEAIQ